MNTRENNSNCMNNVLNKSNNKIFEHQFSILSNKNNNYVNTNGLTTQNDYNLILHRAPH